MGVAAGPCGGLIGGHRRFWSGPAPLATAIAAKPCFPRAASRAIAPAEPLPPSAGLLPGPPAQGDDHGEDQGRQPGRRARRRRDDPDHLAVHQGQADPPLSRHRPPVFRPRRREPGRHERPGHGRGRRGDQAGRRRREMRHHHARRGAREGVRPQGDVEVAERHDPQHPGRRDLPRADHLPERAAPRAGLDAADHRRPPRLRGPVPRDRLQGARQGPPDDQVRGRGRHGDREGGLQVPGRRRRDGDVQPRRLDPRLRPRLAQLRPEPQVPGLSLDQEHDPQGL